MASLLKQIRAVREAGDVQRCHTLPFHGNYDLGKHSYGAVSLLLLLHPGPSLDLIRALMWHDVGERWVGDAPSPTKSGFPDLKLAYDRVEQLILERLDLFPSLTAEEQLWLQVMDRGDLLLWCLDQERLGHQHFDDWKTNCTNWMRARLGDLANKPETGTLFQAINFFLFCDNSLNVHASIAALYREGGRYDYATRLKDNFEQEFPKVDES